MACMPGSRRMFPVAVRKGIPCRGQVAAGFFRATLSRRKVVSLFLLFCQQLFGLGAFASEASSSAETRLHSI